MIYAGEQNASTVADSVAGDASTSAIRERESRNLFLLGLHLIVWRVGWTFKTEKIILPAILDMVAGAGWIRGLLPTLARLGHSVPPLFAVPLLRAARRKKWVLAACAGLACLPYLALAGIWWTTGGEKAPWMVVVLLSAQCLFFVFYGLYQVAFGTLQGKLIRPTRRGRLLWTATFLGLFPTIFFLQWLLPGWIAAPAPGLTYLFLFVGGLFAAAAMVLVALDEPAGNGEPQRTSHWGNLADAWDALSHDANLRRLILMIFVMGLGLTTLPHYQRYLRDLLNLKSQSLVLMVIADTTAVSVYSLLLGPTADRWGYRLTLRLVIVGAAAAPAYALCLPAFTASVGQHFYWLVFVPLALTPLVPTILINYALETCSSDEHPRYVSLVNFALMPPALLSPAVGWLVDAAGFRWVALATALLMLACGALTFWLDEPRKRVAPPVETVSDS